jgi:hypothetical protein
VLPTANGEGNIENLKKAVNQYHNNEGPYMVAEYYPGWLHHWGRAFSKYFGNGCHETVGYFPKKQSKFQYLHGSRGD